MNIPAFDTHQAVKNLKYADFNDTQAEAVVDVMGDAMNQNLATKADLAILGADVEKAIAGVKGEIAEVRTEIAEVRTEIAEVRTEIAEVRIEIAEVRGDLGKRMAEMKAEITAEMAGKFEAINGKFETLYRHLWIMGLGIVIANVTLVAAVVMMLQTLR